MSVGQGGDRHLDFVVDVCDRRHDEAGAFRGRAHRYLDRDPVFPLAFDRNAAVNSNDVFAYVFDLPDIGKEDHRCPSPSGTSIPSHFSFFPCTRLNVHKNTLAGDCISNSQHRLVLLRIVASKQSNWIDACSRQETCRRSAA